MRIGSMRKGLKSRVHFQFHDAPFHVRARCAATAAAAAAAAAAAVVAVAAGMRPRSNHTIKVMHCWQPVQMQPPCHLAIPAVSCSVQQPSQAATQPGVAQRMRHITPSEHVAPAARSEQTINCLSL
jgi:hypothetical protein